MEIYIKQARLKISGIYHDEGTGPNMDRPGWNSVLEAARQKKMQVLMVSSISRICRDPIQSRMELWKLAELGILTYTLRDDFISFQTPLLNPRIRLSETKERPTKEIRTMNEEEGLVLQNCGGDADAWAYDVNGMFTAKGILQRGIFL